MKFFQKLGVVLIVRVGRFQILQSIRKGFGDEASALRAEVSGRVRVLVRAYMRGIVIHGCLFIAGLLVVRAADRCDECAHQRDILHALGRFNATADINRVRAQLTHCASRILRVQATTQNGPMREFCGN